MVLGQSAMMNGGIAYINSGAPAGIRRSAPVMPVGRSFENIRGSRWPYSVYHTIFSSLNTLCVSDRCRYIKIHKLRLCTQWTWSSMARWMMHRCDATPNLNQCIKNFQYRHICTRADRECHCAPNDKRKPRWVHSYCSAIDSQLYWQPCHGNFWVSTVPFSIPLLEQYKSKLRRSWPRWCISKLYLHWARYMSDSAFYRGPSFDRDYLSGWMMGCDYAPDPLAV